MRRGPSPVRRSFFVPFVDRRTPTSPVGARRGRRAHRQTHSAVELTGVQSDAPFALTARTW